jgi:ABC-type Fe3+/spermidine/putrescine transport system ATPase subunit
VVGTAQVLLEGITKQFGGWSAVDGIDLAIERGEIVALLGPSGCGKTTLLRCIAGLEQPSAGIIEISGKVVYSVTSGIDAPPEQRRIGLVFQSYALWPHLTVAENVGYGLKVKGVAKAEAVARVERILATVGLAGMALRYPSTLSGGQQQRVALARSLVVEADVILFDEPFSNLDLKLREEMRFELRQLINRIGVTAIFVTHDQNEAMVLADRICLMKAGRLVQVGSPRAVYERPATRFCMDFLGSSNFVAGTLTGDRLLTLASGAMLAVEGGDVRGPLVGIRPEKIELLPVGETGQNVLPGVIVNVVFLGGTSVYAVDAAGLVLQVHSANPDYARGQKVALRLPPQWLMRLEQ